MNGYRFGLTCPQCGDPLAHEATGHPTDSGRRTVAVTKCHRNGCRRQWLVEVRLIATNGNSARHMEGI